MSKTTHILSRSLRWWVALGLVLTTSAVATHPGLARADGDPASDVLLTERAFVPSDASATTGEQARLDAVLAAAAGAGYPIRVALIASSSDLGSVSALWRQPQNYADFLWQELSFAVHAPVLVVMPGGFGLYTGRSPTPTERAALARTTLAGKPAALATVAVTAIQNLATAAGHPLPAAIVASPQGPAVGAGGTDVASWIVFGLGAVLIVAAWGASLRARPLGGRDSGALSA